MVPQWYQAALKAARCKPHVAQAVSTEMHHKLLSTVPSRKTAPVYTLLPEIELALASGWTRKELWESLSSDGLEVSYKTFNTIIRRARKKPRATAPRSWGKDSGSSEGEQLQPRDVLNSKSSWTRERQKMTSRASFRLRASCVRFSKCNWTGTSTNARTALFSSSIEEGRSERSVEHGGTHASVWGSGALSASIAETQPSGPRSVLRVQN